MHSNQEIKSLIEQINKKKWWHSPPVDSNAYKKRGIFLSSSYKECEFYGRPYDNPVRVCLSNPLIDTEVNIITRIFGADSPQMETFRGLMSSSGKFGLKERFRLDAEIYRTAKKMGYDGIALVTAEGMRKIKEKKLPRSIELNILDLNKSSLNQGT